MNCRLRLRTRFYRRLDQQLNESKFGDKVRAACAPYYKDAAAGRPGIDPEVFVIDASVMEANAALRSPVNRLTREKYADYVRSLAAAEGIDPSDDAAVRRFDKRRPGRKTNGRRFAPPTQVNMSYARVGCVLLMAACTACDVPERGLSSMDSDTASVIGAVLEYRLSIEDSIPLDRRLLPADSLGFLPPFSLPHESLPPSPLLAELAADLPRVTLAPLRRTHADSGWVMSISRPIMLGDSAVVYWASSHFEPNNPYGTGYWAMFFRVDLVRSGDRWRITRVLNAGSEN